MLDGGGPRRSEGPLYCVQQKQKGYIWIGVKAAERRTSEGYSEKERKRQEQEERTGKREEGRRGESDLAWPPGRDCYVVADVTMPDARQAGPRGVREEGGR